MPLLDPFHPPLSERRSWESFHARWASALATWLESGRLPPGHFAAVQLHVGPRIEADVGTGRQNGGGPPCASPTHEQAVATAVWAPPTPGMIVPGVCPDEIAVRIFNKEAGPTLVAAIELLSPRNKHRGSPCLHPSAPTSPTTRIFWARLAPGQPHRGTVDTKRRSRSC